MTLRSLPALGGDRGRARALTGGAPSKDAALADASAAHARAPWRRFNRACYAVASWWQQHREPPLTSAPAPPGASGDAILHVAWGRIGDAILGARALDLLRARTGRRLVVVGRPELAAVLGARADVFVALPRPKDPAAAAAFTAATAGPFHAVVADLHLFHGGLRRLGRWLASREAAVRLAYAGYAPRHKVAPWRPWPAGIEVVPALAKPDAVAARHVLYDTRHYLEAVLARLCAPGRVALTDLAPHLPGIAAGATADVACQPFSHNRKKDWPPDRWRQLFAAFPERRFVLLGGTAEAARTAELGADNVVDLCGATDLGAALHRIAGAAAFIGVDSGLAHAAAALRRPTVVVSHSSNLGYFFPYPAEVDFAHLRVVLDARYEACSGCIATCSREPLWRTYRRGALCLRELPVATVQAALAGALESRPLPARTETAENVAAARR